MTPHDLRLARPLYEGLPWLYMVSGAAALGASYFSSSALVSGAFGFPGLVALIGGLVVWLRRRDYRRMRMRYTHPDALANDTRE